MDKKVRAKWVAALRSGDYTQGKQRLRTRGGKGKDRFCCLGVLADIIAPDDWHSTKASEPLHWRGSADLLPLESRVSLGLSSQSQARLAEMNDGGDTFAVIADYIEGEQ